MLSFVCNYIRLKNFLVNLPLGKDSLVLTRKNIEIIINGQLPWSSLYPQFWENQKNYKKRTQAIAWLEAGFYAFYDKETDEVTFLRV